MHIGYKLTSCPLEHDTYSCAECQDNERISYSTKKFTVASKLGERRTLSVNAGADLEFLKGGGGFFSLLIS